MLLFGFVLAAGIVALLAARKLDIEDTSPPVPKLTKVARQPNTKSAASPRFHPEAIFLRQQ